MSYLRQRCRKGRSDCATIGAMTVLGLFSLSQYEGSSDILEACRAILWCILLECFCQEGLFLEMKAHACNGNKFADAMTSAKRFRNINIIFVSSQARLKTCLVIHITRLGGGRWKQWTVQSKNSVVCGLCVVCCGTSFPLPFSFLSCWYIRLSRLCSQN